MSREAELHAQQHANWNGATGARWVAEQEKLDAELFPVAAAAMALAAPRQGETILDIGCGCGATSLMLAASVGPTGLVTGVDISEQMLNRARERSSGIGQLQLMLADAASHAFSPQSYDLLFSRFGVMFFGDPVAAFTNLRGALRPEGRLVFACWQRFEDNPWMYLPYRIALDRLSPSETAQPVITANDPGPFAFADPDRIVGILTAAGFLPPVIAPLQTQVDLAEGEGLEVAVSQALQWGAVRRLLEDQPTAMQAAVRDDVREALRPYLRDGTVILPGAVWLVSSR